LRAQQGRYLLFDLSSTGGTTVNNHRIHTTTLKPGDVIRMGKTILVYNQEVSGLQDATKAAVILPEPEE
jgi:pSer/pThr/pTyr-binding forkhead associated (FHA) protein